MAASTTIRRETIVDASPSVVLPHLVDLRRWTERSPWEGRDPDLRRTYGGEPGTVGSSYAWKGNRKAGSGDMTVRRVTPSDVEIELRFTAPFRSTNTTAFHLEEQPAGGTRVVWTMTSPVTAMSRITGLFIDMEKFVGGDFEKGLAKLRTVVGG